MWEGEHLRGKTNKGVRKTDFYLNISIDGTGTTTETTKYQLRKQTTSSSGRLKGWGVSYKSVILWLEFKKNCYSKALRLDHLLTE